MEENEAQFYPEEAVTVNVSSPGILVSPKKSLNSKSGVSTGVTTGNIGQTIYYFKGPSPTFTGQKNLAGTSPIQRIVISHTGLEATGHLTVRGDCNLTVESRGQVSGLKLGEIFQEVISSSFPGEGSGTKRLKLVPLPDGPVPSMYEQLVEDHEAQQRQAKVKIQASATPSLSSTPKLIPAKKEEPKLDIKVTSDEVDEMLDVDSLEDDKSPSPSLKSTVDPSPGSVSSKLPSFPLKEMKDFVQLEHDIRHSKERRNQLKERLAKLGGHNYTSVVSTIIKHIMTHELRTQFNWTGTSRGGNKRAFRNSDILHIILEVLDTQHPTVSTHEIEARIKYFLKQPIPPSVKSQTKNSTAAAKI